MNTKLLPLFLTLILISIATPAVAQIPTVTSCSGFTTGDPSLYPINYWTHSAGIATGHQLPEPEQGHLFLAELYAIASEKDNSTFFKDVAGTEWELVGINTMEGLCTLHQSPSITMSPRVEVIQFCETGKKSRVYFWNKPTKTPGTTPNIAPSASTKKLCNEGENFIFYYGDQYVMHIAMDPFDLNQAPACQTHKTCALLKHKDFWNDVRLEPYRKKFPFWQDILLCSAAHADKDNNAIPRFEIYVRSFSKEFKNQDTFSCIRA